MSAQKADPERIKSVIALLQGKWTVHILFAMRDGPVRMGQLKRLIPMASKKALTASLRGLEAERIVVRKDLSNSVLHVEYEISEEKREPMLSLLHNLAVCTSLLSRDAG